MSRKTGGLRSRRHRRDQKYMGIDLAADASFDVTAIGHYDPATGVFSVDQILKVGPVDSSVIDGTAVRVEKDPARLLDAGGSEP